MIVPILLVLLLASFDIARAIAIYSKVRAASSVIAQMANQFSVIKDSDMQQMLGAASLVLSPYPALPVGVVVSLVSTDAQGTSVVAWSDAAGSSPRLVGSKVQVGGLSASSSNLILTEISYSYSPMLGFRWIGEIALSDSLLVAPRSSTTISRSSG